MIRAKVIASLLLLVLPPEKLREIVIFFACGSPKGNDPSVTLSDYG